MWGWVWISFCILCLQMCRAGIPTGLMSCMSSAGPSMDWMNGTELVPWARSGPQTTLLSAPLPLWSLIQLTPSHYSEYGTGPHALLYRSGRGWLPHVVPDLFGQGLAGRSLTPPVLGCGKLTVLGFFPWCSWGSSATAFSWVLGSQAHEPWLWSPSSTAGLSPILRVVGYCNGKKLWHQAYSCDTAGALALWLSLGHLAATVGRSPNTARVRMKYAGQMTQLCRPDLAYGPHLM